MSIKDSFLNVWETRQVTRATTLTFPGIYKGNVTIFTTKLHMLLNNGYEFIAITYAIRNKGISYTKTDIVNVNIHLAFSQFLMKQYQLQVNVLCKIKLNEI